MGREVLVSQTDLIRASLNSTRTELAEVFPHLSDEILGSAPAPGMRTFQGQLVEIIGTEISIGEGLMGKPKRAYSEIEQELWELRTVGELTAKLTEVRSSTLLFLSSLTEGQLDATTEVSAGFANYLELESVTIGEMLRFIVRHEAYHTGQLVSYLWARGNDPYTWD